MLTELLVHDEERSPNSFADLLDVVASEAHVQHVRTTLESIVLNLDGTMDTPAGPMRVTQTILENLAKAIGMPLGFAYRVSYDLFCENFNQHKFVTTCPVTICHVGDVATGLMLDKRNHYQPASSLTILRELRSSGVFDLLDFRRASVSFSGVDVELVKKDLVVEPDEGDTIEMGIVFSNSENGGRHLMTTAHSLRLACSNGCRISEKQGVARWPNDPRMTEKSSILAYTKELDELVGNLASIAEVYSYGDQRVPDTELNSLWRRVAYIASSSEADEIIGLSADQRKALQTTLKKRPFDVLPQPTDFSAYDLHNRITAGAHGRPFLVRRKLQELGGNLLQRSSDWAERAALN